MDYTNCMKILTKKLLALALSASLFAAPLAYAQEVPPDAPAADVVAGADTPIPAIEVPAADVPAEVSPALPDPAPEVPASPDLQGTAGVQDTANTQPAVSSDTLEDTANPETATTTDATVIPIEDSASTTPPQELSDVQDEAVPPVLVEEATSTLDVVAEDIDPTPKPDDTLPKELPLVAEEVASVPVQDLTPDPEFIFSLTGKQIPSKRTLTSKDGKKIGEQTITSPLASSVDNTAGVVSVSGQCSDVYFVVLLYRNQNDYADDPSSYIVNRAFPCVNGSYSYAIAELPNNLANGQYYLLVGQQGERGTWTPITSLTEITINKN